MNKKHAIVLFAAVLMGSQVPARAAAPTPAIPVLETRPEQLKPGMWVTYAFVNNRTNQASVVRLSAHERVDDGQWFEVSITDSRRRRIVFRMLISGVATKSKRVVKSIIQPPGQRAFFLPKKMARQQQPPFQSKRYRGAKLVGKANIRVAGESFATRHYRKRNRDGSIEQAWLCEKLAGWPLVKFVTRNIHLELTGHGADAKSHVQGRPIKLSPRLRRQLIK